MYQMYATDPRARSQRRHPPAARAAARERHRQDQADDTACCCRCPARRSSTTATRSAWATTSTWATATACARRCNGGRSATPASRAPIRSDSTCQPIMDPIYGYEAVNVEAQQREPASLLNWNAPHARRAQGVPGVRPRPTHVPAAGQPQDPRLSPRVWRRDHPVRRQPRALGAAGRARSRALQGTSAGRAHGPHAVPADRRPAVSAHALRPWLSLVPARRGTARCRRGTRNACRATSCRCSCCSTAGRACSAIASCRGASRCPRRSARSSSARCCPPSSPVAAGTRRRARRRARSRSSTTSNGRAATGVGSSRSLGSSVTRGRATPISCR